MTEFDLSKCIWMKDGIKYVIHYEDVKEFIRRQIERNSKRAGWAFDEIQNILDKKEKGKFDINLDIQMKMWTQVHKVSVNEIKNLKEDAGEKLTEIKNEKETKKN